MNPNSTMFDPRPYPYMRCRLSLVSIQDHPYEGAGRGTLERSRARNPLVRPNSLALFWHVPEASANVVPETSAKKEIEKVNEE
ncbi:hypothetical protein ES319_A10G063700v1 [Gossypium barbadense]|uniref:Uncharacterized protein n=2 Tax=Gossypium TaxID=3633 RepID=A0A5J5TZB2_GOSBA|nr:hypothetical protein ES319_A10G063700v1 [Gossypium barbadense]